MSDHVSSLPSPNPPIESRDISMQSALITEILPFHRQKIHTSLNPSTSPLSPSEELASRLETIQVYTCTIDPKLCSGIMNMLGILLPMKGGAGMWDLSHLKRVRRSESESTSSESLPQPTAAITSSKKRKKADKSITNSQRLDIIFCTEQDYTSLPSAIKSTLTEHLTQNNMTLNLQSIPAFPSQSKVMLDIANGLWPQVFHMSCTDEFKEMEMKLSDNEWNDMAANLEHLRTSLNEGGGAVIIDPVTNALISNSQNEKKTLKSANGVTLNNPLQTEIILAIQGVSRIERSNAIVNGGVDTVGFSRGQYLCTGYDVYVYTEPSMYESMALLHSRIRRIIFVESSQIGGLGGDANLGGIEGAVHSLKGANHRFRVFKVNEIRNEAEGEGGRSLFEMLREAKRTKGRADKEKDSEE